ncbi:TrbC/VirB2 family protein [Luteimonas panaciterrae]|uniref:TrbC/VirB2 family protein n=1 Tax=Luteimonas panaciterrae TaxID=363885 RepID=UPI001CFAB2A1|nr:TrbC/VirB2 family protein [Luteimonas panaciterrae]
MKSSTNMINQSRANAWTRFAVAALVLLPMSVWAQDEATGTSGAVCSFLTNINTILNIASIAVVTIAIIFAGYQIAFAHKRISDVAPILIGAVLIGGAAQFAKMILPDNFSNNCGVAINMLQSLQPIYA